MQVAENSYDTPEAAKAVLVSLANHREVLQGMQVPEGLQAAAALQLPAGSTMADVLQVLSCDSRHGVLYSRWSWLS